ncbi:MAG: tetratricopeptide repeat protein, partial [Verrucomicrobiota bacterium]
FLKAKEYYEKLIEVFPNSSKAVEARFLQGDALSALGQFALAIITFEEIVKNYPGNYHVDLAWGRKGDCQYTLGASDPKRYREAIVSYQEVLNSATASVESKLQVEYKIGQSYFKLKNLDKAFEHYMNVVYQYLEQRKRGREIGAGWFSRAGFAAAEIMEGRKRWREAVNIYRRVIKADVTPASAEAEKRVTRIRFEKWMFF